MDGMARAMGGSTTIKWKGETLELPPLQIKDWATVEQEILRRKREAKMEAVSSLYGKIPDEIWGLRLEMAIKDCERLAEIPAAEVQEWVDTRDGLTFTLWLALNKKYPGKFSLEDMLEVMVEQSDDAVAILTQARDQANGVDATGNDIGPA